MLLLWCISFIWGGVLGALTDHGAFYPVYRKIALVLLCFPLCLPLWPRLPLSWARLAFCTAGFLWALCHHAPSLRYPQGTYYVLQGGLFAHSYQPLLVANSRQVVLAFGSAETGSVGTLQGKAFRGTIRSSRTTFYLREKPARTKLWYQGVDDFFRFWQRKITDNLEPRSPFVRGWLDALFFGRVGELNPELQKSFKRLGLFHLLVVSGMHITFLSQLLRWLLLFPFCAAYALRLFSPRWWLKIKSCGELLVFAGLIVFVCLIGQPVSAQRALLISCGVNLSYFICGQVPRTQRLLLVFFAQSLLFPIGLVCESAAMSWLAYLLVIQRSTAGLSWYLTIIEELKKQGIILLLSGFLWGQLSLVSLFMNLIINPLFTPILVASLFLLFAFFFPPIFSTLTTQVIMSSLEIICWLDRRISTYCPWQYWEHLPSFPRWLLLVASILCLMQFFSRERSAHRNL